jgi:hypothetical protein
MNYFVHFTHFVSCKVTKGVRNESFCSFCLLLSDTGGTKWTILFILSLEKWQRGYKMNLFVYFVSCNVTEGVQNELFCSFYHFVSCKVTEGVRNESFCSFCSFCLLKSDRGGIKWTFWFILSLVMWQMGNKMNYFVHLIILSLVKWQKVYEMNHFVHFVLFVSWKVTEGV